MCDRPASPGTGAPTSATDPVSAHASTMGIRRGSWTVIAGASSSYPVSESSGKTTTRAPALRTAAPLTRTRTRVAWQLAENLDQPAAIGDHQRPVGADRRRRPDLIVHVVVPDLLTARAVDGVHVLDGRARIQHAAIVEGRGCVDR